MTPSNPGKALTVLEGIAGANPDLASRYVNPEKYTEHDPHAVAGIEGFKDHIGCLPRRNHLRVLRAFEDGPHVFLQAEGQILDRNIFFHIFRFEDGLIVEHWVFSAAAAPPNESHHTQTDGPTEARHLEDTEKNKSFVRGYYETFHISGDHGRPERYFAGERMIRHEPGVRDGVTEFLRDVEVLMEHRTIDEVKLCLGRGDFVFIAARGTHESDPCVYVDLYRVEDEKIVEHWGFPAKVPPREEWKNHHGML